MAIAARKISINLTITVKPVWRKKAKIRSTYLSHLGNARITIVIEGIAFSR